MTARPHGLSVSWGPELDVTGELGHCAKNKRDAGIIRLSLHQRGFAPKPLTCQAGPPSSCPELKPEPLSSGLATEAGRVGTEDEPGVELWGPSGRQGVSDLSLGSVPVKPETLSSKMLRGPR